MNLNHAMLLATYCKTSDVLGDDTSSLVGPACDGVLEWLLNIFDLKEFFGAIFKTCTFTKASITSYLQASVISDINMIIVYMAGILMVILFFLHLVLVNLNFASDSSQKQTMIELIVRLPITITLILGIPSVIKKIDEIAADVLSKDFFDFTITEAIDNSISSYGSPAEAVGKLVDASITGTFAVILILVFYIAIIIEVIKLLIEIAERSIVLWCLDLFAPFAASTYVSRTTNNIFINYLRMYISQSLLVILNQFFLIIFWYLCTNFAYLMDLSYLILILGVLKTAQRVDSHLKTLGLTVAQTGSMLLDSIGMGIGAITSMARGTRIAVGTAGSILAAKGAATGDMGMAILGNNMSSLARGDIAGMGHEMGMNRAQMRGIFKNTGLGNAASIKEAVTEAKTGNFRPINQLSPEVKTRALASAFGSEGISSILSQTGLDLNQAKNMTINPMNGDISGIVSVKDSTGNSHDVAFKTSSTPINSSSRQISGICGECYITPMHDKVSSGFRAEDVGLMSTMTGANLKDAASEYGKSLGITNNEYDEVNGHGYVSHLDSNGDLVALTDAKTGEFYSMGTNYAQDKNDNGFINISDFAEQDDNGKYTVIAADGLLSSYDFGGSPHIVENSFEIREGSRTAICEVSSNDGKYMVDMSAPSEKVNSLIGKRNYVHVSHLGQKRGDVVISARKVSS